MTKISLLYYIDDKTYSKFIKEASLFGEQSINKFELVIINSAKNISAELQSLRGETKPFINIIEKPCINYAEAMNIGAKNAKYDYIYFINYEPEQTLQTLIAIIESLDFQNNYDIIRIIPEHSVDSTIKYLMPDITKSNNSLITFSNLILSKKSPITLSIFNTLYNRKFWITGNFLLQSKYRVHEDYPRLFLESWLLTKKACVVKHKDCNPKYKSPQISSDLTTLIATYEDLIEKISKLSEVEKWQSSIIFEVLFYNMLSRVNQSLKIKLSDLQKIQLILKKHFQNQCFASSLVASSNPPDSCTKLLIQLTNKHVLRVYIQLYFIKLGFQVKHKKAASYLYKEVIETFTLPIILIYNILKSLYIDIVSTIKYKVK